MKNTPTASQAADELARFSAYGYGATGFASTHRVGIEFLADQNWTDTAQGTDIIFQTTPDGSTTTAEVVRINAAGEIGIGTASPQAMLDVNSTNIIIEASHTPANNATCTAGTIWWDTSYIYVCTASGTVKRATLNTY